MQRPLCGEPGLRMDALMLTVFHRQRSERASAASKAALGLGLQRRGVVRLGIRFRVSARPQPELARSADLVLRKTRIAVFVDGCYWHGCPEHHTQPATNSQYWADKIARNMERDSETTAYLQQTGWMVLRFWEHEDPEAVASQVQEAVQSALAGRRGG